MIDPLKIVDPHVHLWDLWTRIYPHFEKPSKGRTARMPRSPAAICSRNILDEGEGRVRDRRRGACRGLPDRSGQGDGDAADGGRHEPGADRHRLLWRSDVARFPGAARPACGVSDLPRHPAGREPAHRTRSSATACPTAWRIRRSSAGCASSGGAACSSTCSSIRTRWSRRRRSRRRRRTRRSSSITPACGPTATSAGWRQWKAGMRTLAARPNIAVKITGLGMLDPKWTTESIRPLVLETLEAFGAGAGDVRLELSGRQAVLGLSRPCGAPSPRSPTASPTTSRRGLFRDNARRLYRIPH